VWLLSAIWLAPLVLVLSTRAEDPRDGPLDTLYFALTAFFWLNHRIGSTWLAYFTTAYRPLVRAERIRFTVVPIAIAVLCFAAILPDDGALPWSRTQRVMGFVIVDYLLVTYHFASQHFGVLSLYRVRAGRSGFDGLRRLDRAYALLIGGVLVIVAEIVAGTVFFIDVWVDPWIDPDWVAAVAETLRAAGAAIAAVSAAAMIAVESQYERPSLPRAAYVAGVASMVIVAFYARTPFVFLVLWSAQHWIVATGLATLVARGEPAPDRPGRLARALHAVNRRPWAVLLVLAALSVLLLPFLEVEGADDDGALYAYRVFGQFATTLRTSPWVPALIALGLTSAFLHYWLDRAVYRLSNARTREAARGLLAPSSSVVASESPGARADQSLPVLAAQKSAAMNPAMTTTTIPTAIAGPRSRIVSTGF
jgi:hypothetical protein